MKFFAAVKTATFATSLLSKAGLNLETLQAAGDENALKALIDQAGAKPNAEAEQAIAEAATENASLTATLKTATEGLASTNASLHALNTTLAAEGLPVAKPEEFKAALAAHVSKQTTLALARGGHPPVAELPEGATPAAAAKPTGLAAVQASFAAKFKRS